MRTKPRLPVAWLVMTLLVGLVVALLLFASPAAHAADAVAAAARAAGIDSNWVFAAAAASTGLSSLGAAFAVARVGTAAVGALAEKPELFGRLLILVGLAEGIAIYGLIVSILMLNRLG